MKRYRMHLYQKLIIVLIITIGPICVLSIMANREEQNLVLNVITDSLISRLTFYTANLNDEMERLQNSTYACTNDEEFIKLAVVYNELSDYKRIEGINNIRKKLILFRQMSPYIHNLWLFMPDLGRSINSLNYDYEISDNELDMMKVSLDNGLVKFYQGKLLIYSAYPNGVSLKMRPSLLMAVEVSQSAIENMLKAMETMDGGGAILLSDEWGLASGRMEDEEMDMLRKRIGIEPINGNSSATVTFRGEDYLFVWQYCDSMNAKLISYLPQQLILVQLKSFENWMLVLILAAIALVICAAVMEYHAVHVPITHMVQAFTKVENGKYDVHLTTAQHDEFQYLFGRFNHMMETISGLIEQVYKQKILSQQAQLKQLQAQINPHFFYNSFFIAQGMVDMGENEAASKMLGNLGRYFQYVTRSGKDVIPLQREVAHAWAYCEIQQVRFPSTEILFDELDDELRGVMVPRLILQPLLENAFLHGLEDKQEGSVLQVKFEHENGFLKIHVINNGESISNDELATLRERMNTPDDAPLEVTGIVNIHRRLRLRYGSPCGLSIEQLHPEGTHVVATLRIERGQSNVPSADG